ncbi:hypothetical protein ACQPZG_00930 (plasmid) [Streptomyces sp. CA-294286]|uniref:hypothetical protein n=1 Tax=Streptomyces sp. CA-294286 TaxID=3240070 RepID=UPI003D8BEB9A
MRKTGTPEGCTASAAGRGDARGSLYAYRVRGLGRSGLVLWIAGEDDGPDQVLTSPGADRRQVPVFLTLRQARVYVGRRGRRLAGPEANTLELARVQHWLEDPVRRRVPWGAVLEAWNFFEDLARGLAQPHRLPQQNSVHDSAYEKLFGGEHAEWTPAEQRAVRELIAAGVELWNSCPVLVKPPSRPVCDGGRGVRRDL